MPKLQEQATFEIRYVAIEGDVKNIRLGCDTKKWSDQTNFQIYHWEGTEGRRLERLQDRCAGFVDQRFWYG